MFSQSPFVDSKGAQVRIVDAQSISSPHDKPPHTVWHFPNGQCGTLEEGESCLRTHWDNLLVLYKPWQVFSGTS
jgi:hypothetical protein